MHRIERLILHALIRNPCLRYTEIKPHNIEANLFMYHLKRFINDGLVSKNELNKYELTPKGKRLADKLHLETLQLPEQPRIVILMAVHKKTGEWLLHRRKVQPLINMVGFLHANAVLGESIFKSANKRLKEMTGLTANFKHRGNGYISIYKKGDVESYICFNLLEATNITGKLIQESELGYSFWQQNPIFTKREFIPSMPELSRLLLNNKTTPFFVELTHRLN